MFMLSFTYCTGLRSVHLRHRNRGFGSHSGHGRTMVFVLPSCYTVSIATPRKPDWAARRGSNFSSQEDLLPDSDPTVYSVYVCLVRGVSISWDMPFSLPKCPTPSTKEVTKTENWRLWTTLPRSCIRIILEWMCILTGVYFMMSRSAGILSTGNLLSPGMQRALMFLYEIT
jgi:hypothetical protein